MPRVVSLACLLALAACSGTHKSAASPANAAAQDSANAAGSTTGAAAAVQTGGALTMSTVDLGALFGKDVISAPADCLQIDLDATNASGTIASEAVSLSTSSKTGAFYKDATCTRAVAAPVAPATVYYKDSNPGSSTLTVADAGASKLASATLALVLAYPTTFQFIDGDSAASLSTASVALNTCKAIDVQFANAQGEAVAIGTPTPVEFSLHGAAKLYSNDTCTTAFTSATIAAGQSNLGALPSLFLKASQAGSVVLTASLPASFKARSREVNGHDNALTASVSPT